MPINFSRADPGTSESPPRPLTPGRRYAIVLAGALLGAIIGPSGFLLQMRWNTYQRTGEDLVAFPGPLERWADRLESIGSFGAGQLFLLCAFLATLALMPFLVRWLESRIALSRAAYYRSAATGGVVFGVAATFLVAWMLAFSALIIGTVTGPSVANAATTAAGLLGGLFVFGPLVGLMAPFFFILAIVGIGIPFGLLHGAAVRRLASRNAVATA